MPCFNAPPSGVRFADDAGDADTSTARVNSARASKRARRSRGAAARVSSIGGYIVASAHGFPFKLNDAAAQEAATLSGGSAARLLRMSAARVTEMLDEDDVPCFYGEGCVSAFASSAALDWVADAQVQLAQEGAATHGNAERVSGERTPSRAKRGRVSAVSPAGATVPAAGDAVRDNASAGGAVGDVSDAGDVHAERVTGTAFNNGAARGVYGPEPRRKVSAPRPDSDAAEAVEAAAAGSRYARDAQQGGVPGVSAARCILPAGGASAQR